MCIKKRHIALAGRMGVLCVYDSESETEPSNACAAFFFFFLLVWLVFCSNNRKKDFVFAILPELSHTYEFLIYEEILQLKLK